MPKLKNMKLPFLCQFIACLSLNSAQLMLKEFIENKQNSHEKEEYLTMMNAKLMKYARQFSKAISFQRVPVWNERIAMEIVWQVQWQLSIKKYVENEYAKSADSYPSRYIIKNRIRYVYAWKVKLSGSNQPNQQLVEKPCISIICHSMVKAVKKIFENSNLWV